MAKLKRKIWDFDVGGQPRATHLLYKQSITKSCFIGHCVNLKINMNDSLHSLLNLVYKFLWLRSERVAMSQQALQWTAPLHTPSEFDFYLCSHAGIQVSHSPVAYLLTYLFVCSRFTHLHFLPTGHKPSLSLSRLVGWQLFHGRRTATVDLPALPHLRALHTLRLYPRTSLLRPACGVPCPLPLSGQRPWQVISISLLTWDILIKLMNGF